jgi:membrane protease YdiL (CAAX protease family)
MSGFSYVLLTEYSVHLVRTQQFSLARTLEEYLPAAQGLLFLIALLIVLPFFFLSGHALDLRTELSLNRSAVINAGVGFLAGFIALLITLPVLLRSAPSELATLLANNFYTGTGVGLALLVFLFLPIAAEIFFRGILIKQLLESISVPAALIISTLLFIFCWPGFSWIAAGVLGLVTGFAFYRTKSLLACVVTNASFAIGTIVLQISLLL